MEEQPPLSSKKKEDGAGGLNVCSVAIQLVCKEVVSLEFRHRAIECLLLHNEVSRGQINKTSSQQNGSFTCYSLKDNPP